MKPFLTVAALLLTGLPALVQAGTISLDTGFYEAPGDETLPLMPGLDAQNVILLIGDGMGFNQVSAAQFTAVGPDGKLHMQSLPVTGLMNTSSLDALITDSAASGTALATGHKTNNRMISTLPDGSTPQTILEAAEDAGLATGLIATSDITHATPAVFAAHNESRYNALEIAADMMDSGADVLFGGGWKHWLPVPHGDREDGRNLIDEMRESGYSAIRTRAELMEQTTLPVIGLFNHSPLQEPHGATAGAGGTGGMMGGSGRNEGSLVTAQTEPSIAEMTRRAIRLLATDEDGFFLMVEGSQIDWEGHANEEDELVRRLLLFDMAVAEALAFARDNGETLVIVTSDHETGGMTLTKGRRDGSSIVAQFSSPNHTGGMVPVFAFGPGAEMFTGMLDNTDIPVRVARALNLRTFAPAMD